ncbi:PIG-L deacetylase family protein [Bradyrhizobium oligotrophicum]|uniref:PIG-L deacetylase family protein n=1 Tax=Bradyrhizobium oligotrophicum TaxID=44255 RepID=UPI003EBB9640
MRADRYFEALRSCPVVTVDELVQGRPFVVLSPHPDDETLGAGGLIAESCAAGGEVDIIVVTDGSGSHPRSQQYPREKLVALRYAEVHAAGRALGLHEDRVTFLGLRDTMAPMSGPDFDEAVQTTLDVVRRSGAGALFVTWEGDPHCDHQASAALAKAVRRSSPGLKLWAYPVWGWHLVADTEMQQPPPTAVRIDISSHRDRKRAAIDAHASQMTGLIGDDPDGFRFNDTSLAPFLGQFEYFIEVPS